VAGRPDRHSGDARRGVLGPAELENAALACALNMDRVADKLLSGDAVQRAIWLRVLGRANDLVYERDQRHAALVAQALNGKG